MNGLEAVSALPPVAANAELSLPEFPTLSPARTGATEGFGKLVTEGLGEVNRALMGSQVDLQQLATGKAENLHQIMIRLEESRISFQLFLQVRNRLLEAYQDIMKMQV